MRKDLDKPGNHQNLPWYRYGMVWMVIALPLAVVVASLFTISIAVDSAPVIIQKEPQSSAAADLRDSNESPLRAAQK